MFDKNGEKECKLILDKIEEKYPQEEESNCNLSQIKFNNLPLDSNSNDINKSIDLLNQNQVKKANQDINIDHFSLELTNQNNVDQIQIIDGAPPIPEDNPDNPNYKKNNEKGKDDLNEVKKKGNQEVGCDDILEGCLLLCQCLELILRIAGGN